MAPTAAVRAAVKVVVREIANNLIVKLQRKRNRKKRVWIRDWIRRRSSLGVSQRLLKELSAEDPDSYRNFMRMSHEKFQELLKLVEPKLTKSETWMRNPISPQLKLEVTLRYLATGDSFASLQYLYRIPKCTISVFLPEVLLPIYEVLAKYITVPSTEDDWKVIQRGFSSKWNFPQCCGSIDGKHVQVQRPPNSGSEFYNYKGTYSIILFALVDANYCFKYIEVGANGRANDSTIFRNSTLNRAMLNGDLHFPQNSVIVGDDAFPLRTNLLKPYCGTLTTKQRIFNYRLSRARRVVENAFGILSVRFRLFRGVINLKPSTVDLAVKAACALHNWLRMTDARQYCPFGTVDREDIDTGDIIDGFWRSEGQPLESVRHLGINNHSQAANSLRDKYADYFSGEGAVPWQDKMIGL